MMRQVFAMRMPLVKLKTIKLYAHVIRDSSAMVSSNVIVSTIAVKHSVKCVVCLLDGFLLHYSINVN